MSKPLFDSLEEIAPRIEEAAQIFLCLDYDGTVAPIVDEPAQASLPPHMQRVLWTLAGQEGLTIAIVSGRERADLQQRVGIPGLTYIGNHGLEISGPGFLFVEPTAAEHTEALKALGADLSKKLQGITGVIVEDKGLTLSVHYRIVDPADQEEVRRIVHSALAVSTHPFHLTMGDKVFEIRPRVYWNKGSAATWIMEQMNVESLLAIYLGDDATDEDAFAKLPDAITIKVGDASDSLAHYYLEDCADVRRFLEWLELQMQKRTGAVPVPVCVPMSA